MANNQKNFSIHSNGKLLLSGEYFVLADAISLALPLNYGQSLKVEDVDEQQSPLIWEAKIKENDWFYAVYKKKLNNLVSTNNLSLAKKLQNILLLANEMSHQRLQEMLPVKVTTLLDFDKNWGLGSSSTLIANISKWLNIDPYLLNNGTFKSSGYDIACAMVNKPILFQNTPDQIFIREIDYRPAFSKHLLFIYSGQKQDSKKSISQLNQKILQKKETVKKISELSIAISQSEELDSFMKLIKEHEEIISRELGLLKTGDKFPDFQGQLKSLGAWGGDMFLAISPLGEGYIRSYFKARDLHICFTFDELIKMNA